MFISQPFDSDVLLREDMMSKNFPIAISTFFEQN